MKQPHEQLQQTANTLLKRYTSLAQSTINKQDTQDMYSAHNSFQIYDQYDISPFNFQTGKLEAATQKSTEKKMQHLKQKSFQMY